MRYVCTHDVYIVIHCCLQSQIGCVHRSSMQEWYEYFTGAVCRSGVQEKIAGAVCRSGVRSLQEQYAGVFCRRRCRSSMQKWCE